MIINFSNFLLFLFFFGLIISCVELFLFKYFKIYTEKSALKRYVIIFLDLIFGFSLILWFIGLPATFMLFDAPESINLWFLQVASFDYLIYPVIVIISIISSLKFRLLWVIFLPFVNILVFFGLLSIFWK